MPRLYLVTGKDEYLRKEAVLAIENLLKNSDAKLANKRFSGEKLQIKSLTEELSTLGFFSELRIVLVDQVDALNKSAIEELLPYLNSPSKDCFLILSAASIRKNSALYKSVEKNGAVIDLPELKPWEKEKALVPWLSQQAKTQGKILDASCAKLLLNKLGDNQELLLQELEKLYCFTGERSNITPDDIQAITTQLNLQDSWKLGEAIFRLDGGSAMRICGNLFNDGAVLIMLLRQLRSQFQTDAKVASMLACNSSTADITKAFPYMRGRLLDQHLLVARNYGLKKLQEGLIAIDALELAAKSTSSSSDPLLLMESLIAKLTTP